MRVIRISDLIVADNSNPQSIAALQNAGYNVIGGDRTNIQEGISQVKRFHMRIHEYSINIQHECQNYIYKSSKSAKDKMTNEPVDRDNHALDGVRYYADFKFGTEIFSGQDDMYEDIRSMVFTSDFG